MKSGISGFVCVRNAISLDYCVIEAVKSLIPICDEVVVCDGESTDGTWELVSAIGDSRIRLITYPWPNPVGNPRSWVDWLNFARAHLRYRFQVTLDADEVFHENGLHRIVELAEQNRSGIFQRYNFWNDANHLAPLNTVCGDTVARCGPQELYCPSDEPIPAVSPNLRDAAEYESEVKIFHYGFLRDPTAFIRKSKAVQTMLIGSCDARILEQEAAGEDWRNRDYFNGKPLRNFHGTHPKVIHSWLWERGYSTEIP